MDTCRSFIDIKLQEGLRTRQVVDLMDERQQRHRIVTADHVHWRKQALGLISAANNRPIRRSDINAQLTKLHEECADVFHFVPATSRTSLEIAWQDRHQLANMVKHRHFAADATYGLAMGKVNH